MADEERRLTQPPLPPDAKYSKTIVNSLAHPFDPCNYSEWRDSTIAPYSAPYGDVVSIKELAESC